MVNKAEERKKPGYWAEYLPVWDEPIAEGLHGASCSPACKAIATCAAAAWEQGWTAEQWRQDVLSQHPEEEEVQLILTAEECMRTSGLWLWNEHST